MQGKILTDLAERCLLTGRAAGRLPALPGQAAPGSGWARGKGRYRSPQPEPVPEPATAAGGGSNARPGAAAAVPAPRAVPSTAGQNSTPPEPEPISHRKDLVCLGTAYRGGWCG